jgi:predicted ATPase/class 3 adenylate cyclase
MVRQPSGTVTFLFTDIEGSTRLLGELGTSRYSEALDAHCRLLRAAFERHDGYEVNYEGDAFVIAFQNAHDAVAAAAEGQRALAEHAWPEGHELRVRMGLHTGEPELAPPKYVGIDVHRAARIAAAGHGGQILLSQSTRDLVQGDDLRDLGEYRLKDLAAPERIWQLGEADFPPLKSLYQTNLPVPATPFVGRERELAEATDLLQDGVRLLTLSGPGGTGKTRLAMQAAAAAADGYPDGAWWVSLAPLNDATLVLTTASEVLGAKNDLAAEIADKRLLLVLDNFEHVIDAAPEISNLLAACPHLTVLVTSRERLQVTAEHEYAVPAMAPQDALALFSARAGALGVEVSGGDANDLCERLDNLPLALELAAARTKLFTPGQLLERLGQRLDLFKGGRDADPRQRTLRATIEWSYDLLTPEEQQLFARLSVFAGGCTYEAAEAICEADEDTLQSLLDKSLLRRRDAALGNDSRYWMLQTIREFAVERLNELQEREEATRLRHAEYFAAFVTSLLTDGRASSHTQSAFAELDREYDNVRWALAATVHFEWAELLLQMTHLLYRFWDLRGYFEEGRRWCEAALTIAPADDPRRAKCLHAVGIFAALQGDPACARERIVEYLRFSRALGDDRDIARALNALGWLTRREGDLEEAREAYTQSADLARASGDPETAALAMGNLADLELYTGRFSVAAALAAECLSLAEERDDQLGMSIALGNFAVAAVCEGRVSEALDAARRLIEISVAIGWREGVAFGLEVSAAACAREEPSHAATLLGAAARIRMELGVELERFEQEMHDRIVSELCELLGEDPYSDASRAGETLAEADAIELVVGRRNTGA